MPTPEPTTRRLQAATEELLTVLDQHGRAGLIQPGVWAKLRPRVRVAARLAQRADCERMAALGYINCGRVSRDVAAALARLCDDDDPLAA